MLRGAHFAGTPLSYVSELDDEITDDEVTQAILGMKANRTPGIDGIPAEVYKVFNSNFMSLLTTLFNSILRTGSYPTIWSTGIIIPIHKGGSREELSNYRGITLLSSMGKIFTSILCARLTEWAYERSFIPDSQFGFRQYRRATDCIFILNALVENTLCNHTPLYVSYVDLKKLLIE